MATNNENPSIPLSHADEREGQDGRSAQYASGGVPGIAMAIPASNNHAPFADLKNSDVSQEDFLMIQLSSFEGRASH